MSWLETKLRPKPGWHLNEQWIPIQLREAASTWIGTENRCWHGSFPSDQVRKHYRSCLRFFFPLSLMGANESVCQHFCHCSANQAKSILFDRYWRHMVATSNHFPTSWSLNDIDGMNIMWMGVCWRQGFLKKIESVNILSQTHQCINLSYDSIKCEGYKEVELILGSHNLFELWIEYLYVSMTDWEEFVSYWFWKDF